MLDQEVGCLNIDREQAVEIRDRGLLDRCRFRDAGIGNENVEAIADDAAHLSGEIMRTIRSSEIGRNGVGATACAQYLGDYGISLLGAASVVNKDLCPGGGKRKRAGAADPARRTSDKSGFSGKVGHDAFLRC